MSPNMKYAVEKINNCGNKNVFIDEKYVWISDLVIDFRGIKTMKKYAPVVDVTHSTISVCTGGYQK